MNSVTVGEAESRFFDVLVEVEAGEEIAVTRHGNVVARIVPDRERMAADVFREFRAHGDIDLQAPEDLPAEAVASLDD